MIKLYLLMFQMKKALEKTQVPGTTISKMVLGSNESYISSCLGTGKFNIQNLELLCSFLGIPASDVVLSDKYSNENIYDDKTDLLVVGLNRIYETIQKQSEVFDQLLIEIKALNVKQNRLENALGQIVINTLTDKELNAKIKDDQVDIISKLNVISGRLKDISKLLEG